MPDSCPYQKDCKSDKESDRCILASKRSHGRLGARYGQDQKWTNTAHSLRDQLPTRLACSGEIPSRMRGIETAIPSGKFWIPMPIARETALPKVAPGEDPIAPKATPTAIPSGGGSRG
eukprot:scaffold43597_cov33-Tisochrysis_lutea.AAC.2